MKIAIVDPGSGNLASVQRALTRVAAEQGIQADIRLTDSAGVAAAADRIVLPGQGAFAACRRGLDAMQGMVAALNDFVLVRKKPFLGICVGMQLMAERGLEHGTTPGLCWIKGEIAPMDPRDAAGAPLPLPQMGWNGLILHQPSHPLLAGVAPGTHGYFVHSFGLAGGDPAEILASAAYGALVPAIVGRENFAGTQFHVEKSSLMGLRILANFLRWTP